MVLLQIYSALPILPQQRNVCASAQGIYEYVHVCESTSQQNTIRKLHHHDFHFKRLESIGYYTIALDTKGCCPNFTLGIAEPSTEI